MANERLIDANALDEKLEILKVRFKAQGRDSVADDYNFVQTVLSTAPTVDAVPVVPGEWSTIEDDYTGMTALECSECKQEYWFEDEPPMKIYRYCPNCGAKMDGGENNE